MNLPDMLGSLAGTLTTIAFIPQVVKTWKTKSTHDISLIMFSLFTTGVLLWLVYGIVIGAIPIIVANSITLMFAGTILYFKLRFK